MRRNLANVGRQPLGGSVTGTTAGRTRPGSPITAKQNQRNTRQNAAFGSPSRSARVHQPADAGRSPASTWSTALPPSSHAVRANDQSKRPRSRTDRRPQGPSCSFDQTQARRAKHSLATAQVREPAPVDRSRGRRRMGRRRKRRTPSWVVRVREPARAKRLRGCLGGVPIPSTINLNRHAACRAASVSPGRSPGSGPKNGSAL